MVGPTDDSIDELPVFPDSRFEATTYIGAGSNATIFSARDRNLGRWVALKMSSDDAMLGVAGREQLAALGIESGFTALLDGARQDQGRYSLLREARLLAKVEHANVIVVLDVGRMEDGAVTVVMPLLNGGSLDQQRPIARWQKVLELALQIGNGLTAIHDAGIIHRDFKPNNVLFDAHGCPQIADLGLACRLDDDDAMAEWVGTARYMSPEVLERRFRDRRDDLYAYCSVVFELFYGWPPFATLEARLAGQVADIRRPGGMPSALREVLVQGLHPDAAERWPDMRALLVAMQRAAKPRRGRVAIAAGVASTAALGIALGMFTAAGIAEAGECEEVADELAQVWNRDIQSEIRGAFGTRIAGDRLQHWASRWVAVRAQECEAAKRADRSIEPSPCTDKIRDRFEATVDAFRAPHLRRGLHFGAVIAGLPAPEHCIDHPDDGDWGDGGLLELRKIDIEVSSLVLLGNLETARARQHDYMALAQELSFEYGITRAIFWRGEIGRLEGDLDHAHRDFEIVYADAQALGVPLLGAEAMFGLTAIASVRGDIAVVNSHALAARAVFARYEPQRVAALLQVQGLALLTGSEPERERGVALLGEALELREGASERQWDSRESLSQARENYARGLLAVHRADEALEYLELALGEHQLEFGHGGWRTHEILRQKFVALVKLSRFDQAMNLQDAILEIPEVENWERFVQDAFWLAEVYLAAGKPLHAAWPLQMGRAQAIKHGLIGDADRFERKLADVLAQ